MISGYSANMRLKVSDAANMQDNVVPLKGPIKSRLIAETKR